MHESTETERTVAADAYWWIADCIKTESGWSVQEHVQWMRELLQECSERLHSDQRDEAQDGALQNLCAKLRACLAGECPNGRFEERP